jgi:hypothetical protein
MARLLAKTCWLGYYNKSTSIKLKCIRWLIIHFIHLINAWNMEHIKIVNAAHSDEVPFIQLTEVYCLGLISNLMN